MKDSRGKGRARELSPAAVISLIFIILVVTIAAASTYWPRVDEVDIWIADLPVELDGIRILHLSDLHSSSGKNLSVDIPGALHDRSFDLACITGDFVDGELAQLPPVVDLVEKLARRTPVITVLGNHDWEAGGRHVIAELEYAGSANLENASTSVVFDGFELRVVG
ncbi:MAG: metallophosphoesterase, partial [Bacillota bacterium]